VGKEVAMTRTTDGIVAGYDGSPGSDEALRWAAREARARGTALTICLVWAPDELALPGDGRLRDRARQRGEEILAHAARLAGSDLAEVRTVMAEGPPARLLCELSGTAEMVVVGSSGHDRLAGSLLGPVSWQVACQGQGRIVVVRGQWRPVNQTPGPVVAGVDGSPPSQEALTFAFEEAQLRSVPVSALCALADAPSKLGGMGHMEDGFSHLMTSSEKKHPEVTVLRQVTCGSPRSALLTAAGEAQLLVLGARGLGGVEDMSLGSVAVALLHHAPCPVAVIHPRAAS
jgi:nucleotide-binding universal stress UspA family protein